MSDAKKNFSYSTVATAPSPATSGTSLVVVAGEGSRFPDPATEGAYNAIIWPSSGNPLSSNAEIVRVTARSTDTLTITRQQEGTSARTIVVGDQIMVAPTKKVFEDAEAAVQFPITQATHGFSSGNAIYHNGTSWAKAKADAVTTLGTHIAVVIDTNNFYAVQAGRITLTAHGLGSAGDYLFVSAVTAGVLTTTEPLLFSNPIVYVESVNVIHVLPFRSIDVEKYTLNGFSGNQLINGNFDRWERGTSFITSLADDRYCADRWNLLTETNGAISITQSTDVPNTKSKYSCKVEVSVGNNQGALVQFLENIDTVKLVGRTVSLSFAAKTTTGQEISNLRATVLAWDGAADTLTSDVIATWQQNGTDPTWANNWTSEKAGSNLALTGSWQTFKIENIVLDTANTTNLAIIIWVDDGTITGGDEFFITQIQLNIGKQALPFHPKSIHEEVVACQRYCFVPDASVANADIGQGQATSTGQAFIQVKLPVTMRIPPSLTATASDWQVADGVNAAADVSSFTLFTSSTNKNVVALGASATGLTQYRPYRLVADGTANHIMIFDAEL